MAEQLETAHFNNALLRREMKTMGNAQNIAIQAMIRCQGLLAQFIRPDVRTAFLGGLFNGLDHTAEMLSSVDLIKDVILPSPSSVMASPDNGDAVDFVTKLLSRDTSEPVDVCGNPLPHRQSFAAWRSFFRELAGHRVWDIMPGEYTATEGGVRAKTKSKTNSKPLDGDRIKEENGAPASRYSLLSPIPPFQGTSSPRANAEPPFGNPSGRRKKTKAKTDGPPATVYLDSSLESSSDDSSSSSVYEAATPNVKHNAATGGDGSIVELLRNIQIGRAHV
jgi:hypothetical protein